MSGMVSNASCPECCQPRGASAVTWWIPVPEVSIEAVQQRLEELFHQVQDHAERIGVLESRRGGVDSENVRALALQKAADLLRRMAMEDRRIGCHTRATALDDAAEAIDLMIEELPG